MVSLHVVSGAMAGVEVEARHFPFRINRSAGADLRLEQPGVWESHLELRRDWDRGILLKADANALTLLNGEPAREELLKNGDTIELGDVRLRFWLGAVRQTGIRVRENVTWIALGLLTCVQAVLAYWLTH